MNELSPVRKMKMNASSPAKKIKMNELSPVKKICMCELPPRSFKRQNCWICRLHAQYVYVGSEASLPPEMWAGCRSCSMRTTNVCEGFNVKLNGIFYHKHPHIVQLLGAFLEIQDFSFSRTRSQRSREVDVNEQFLED